MYLHYDINLYILSKYNDQARFYYDPKRGVIIDHTFDFSQYYSDKNSLKQIEKALYHLNKEAHEVQNHIGNLIYLAEPNLELDDLSPFTSPATIAVYNMLSKDLMNLYRLLKLEENEKDILSQFNIDIKHKSREHDLDINTADSFVNKYLVKSLIEGYKKYIHDNYSSLYWPIPNFSMNEPLDVERILETANSFLYESRKNSPEAHLRDEKLKLILTYLNNETNINPSKKAMPVKAARIIYWLLILFNIIPETNTKVDSYIISLNNNVDKRLRDGVLKYWFLDI